MNITLITGNNVVDTATASVAASAVASPVWLPLLTQVSEGAAMVAPILGCIWLVVQIITKVSENYRRKRNKDE